MATNESNESQKIAHYLPGWTLLIGAAWWVIAPMILEASRDFGLSWYISVPATIVVVVVGSFAERWIERKYSPSRSH